MNKEFEIANLQYSPDGSIELTIRDKNSYLAYYGKLKKLDIPQTVYPPNYFDK